MSEDFPEIKIPFWMDGKHTRTLARASRRWWEEVGDWARFPLKQLDPMTCTDRMLDLMAWQRGVTRTVGEADRLYRLRVKHAYANAKDAGQVAGWERIFRRLELGKVAQEERQDGQDWDVIGIGIDDSAFPDVQNVLELIVADYGRTCRRYRFISRIPMTETMRVISFDDNSETVCAVAQEIMKAGRASGLGIFDHNHNTLEARA